MSTGIYFLYQSLNQIALDQSQGSKIQYAPQQQSQPNQVMMTRSTPAVRTPACEPTFHQFVSSYEHYRKQGIVPSGWVELTPTRRSRRWSIRSFFERRRCRKSDRDLREIEYSRANMLGPGAEGIEDVTILLTLTIPDLPFRAWCPTPWCFEPHEAVRIIKFAADGFVLKRVPLWGELRQPSSERQVNIQPASTQPRSRAASLVSGSSVSSLRVPSSVAPWSERRDSAMEQDDKESEFTPDTGASDECLTTEQKYLAFGMELDMSEFEWLLPAITVLLVRSVQ